LEKTTSKIRGKIEIDEADGSVRQSNQVNNKISLIDCLISKYYEKQICFYILELPNFIR
jgi:hypothetical protein